MGSDSNGKFSRKLEQFESNFKRKTFEPKLLQAQSSCAIQPIALRWDMPNDQYYCPFQHLEVALYLHEVWQVLPNSNEQALRKTFSVLYRTKIMISSCLSLGNIEEHTHWQAKFACYYLLFSHRTEITENRTISLFLFECQFGITNPKQSSDVYGLTSEEVRWREQRSGGRLKACQDIVFANSLILELEIRSKVEDLLDLLEWKHLKNRPNAEHSIVP